MKTQQTNAWFAISGTPVYGVVMAVDALPRMRERLAVCPPIPESGIAGACHLG